VAKTISLRSARSRRQARKSAEAATARAQARRLSLLFDHGRAWINGSEVGGCDPRFEHLNHSYD
jgi:hypothetical protein